MQYEFNSLFHPHDDPDDHFDLATIFAMPEVDLKGIVLDQGDKQLNRPGAIPVSQMNKITGRNAPTVLGLTEKLKTPTDKALDQRPEFQKGVEFILHTLRNSPSPVMITTVGSWLWNRSTCLPPKSAREVGKLNRHRTFGDGNFAQRSRHAPRRSIINVHIRN